MNDYLLTTSGTDITNTIKGVVIPSGPEGAVLVSLETCFSNSDAIFISAHFESCIPPAAADSGE
jgi:hypothetical protein